ncbi:YfhJ family protein [Alteribacter aurantiacus]|uniref:YfhJ family protein n=1 Tax=Alteribacter aurantiacus TaxID=254410 RepID=UPI00041B4332|nr:YfhJ family protein [Alteribacter aurantiacus]
MNDYFDRLTNRLLEKNDQMTSVEARRWVELLWEDFESTYAKAGRKYRGKEMTEMILLQWINQYGSRLHEVMLQNPKFKQHFEDHGNSTDYQIFH